MNTLDIPTDIKNDIMTLIDSFYQKFHPEMEKLRVLEIIESEPITKDQFYNTFTLSHNDIRQDTKNRVRYFILKKHKKLHGNISNHLPEHENVMTYCVPSTIELYWDTLFHSYMLLESCRTDKDESVITTIVSVIEKASKEAEEKALEEEEKKKRKEEQIERKAQIMEKRMEKVNMPDVKELMAHVKDPKIAKAINELGGRSGLDFDKLMKMAEDKAGGDINGVLKGALSENKEIASILTTLMDSFNNTDGNINLENINSVLSSIIPPIDHTCHVNAVLIDKIYSDLIYVYEKKDESFPPLTNRVSTTITKYMDIIKKGILPIEELVGCMWKVATDEDKQEYVKNMEKETIDGPSIKIIIKKFIPRQILRQIPVDIDSIVDTIFNNNFAEIGSLMDMAKNFMTSQSGDVEEEQLTDDQMAELEAHYDKLMATVKDESTVDTSSSKKSKKSIKSKKAKKI